jgi:hypothetical protein
MTSKGGLKVPGTNSNNSAGSEKGKHFCSPHSNVILVTFIILFGTFISFLKNIHRKVSPAKQKPPYNGGATPKTHSKSQLFTLKTQNKRVVVCKPPLNTKWRSKNAVISGFGKWPNHRQPPTTVRKLNPKQIQTATNGKKNG